MVAGFSVSSLALDAQTDIVSTQRIVSEIEIKKQQEQFGIIASTDVNDHLNVSINNQGQNPVEISSIWITNKTLPDQPSTRYDINYDDAFIPSGFTSDVVSTQVLEMIPDTYNIKVVSSFGSIKTVELDMIGGGTFGLRAEMVTDPPDVIIGQNVTIAMLVTNTGILPITNVIPNALGYATTGTLDPPITSPPTPTFANLDRGESVLFTWDYLVTGASGDELTFSSSATGDGPVISNPVSDISILREPTDGGTGGGGTTINILSDELLARPQIFLTIPGPYGDDSNNHGLWGVNVVNPVNSTMDVSKITILLTGPGITGNGSLFDCGSGDIVVVEGPDNWSCPNVDTLMWENTGSPVTISPFSVQSFSVRVVPDQHTGQPSSMEALNVQANVFTSVGSFGKSGYQTTMHTPSMAISNVYLSTNVDSIDPAHMKTSRSNITPDNTETFNIVFAELETGSSTYINSGKLIINIPKEWTNVTVLNNPTSGFINPAVVNAFGDNSHQIVATLPACSGSACMGGNSGSSGEPTNTIQFSARSPDVATDSMYVMYVLATGEANDSFTVGNLSEIVLQVNAP